MVRRLLAGALLFGAFAVLPARAQPAFSLDELLRMLREESPVLRAARIEAQALATRRAQVTALPDPMASAMLAPAPVFRGEAPHAELHVEQMLPVAGMLRIRGEMADLAARMATFDSDEMELELAMAVRQSYAELLRVQEQLRLVAAFRERMQDFEEIAAVRYEVGTGMQGSVLKAQLEKNMLDLEVARMEDMRRMQRERLARLIGRPLPAGDALPMPLPDLAAALPGDAAIASRPEAAALGAAREMAAREMAMARLEFRPEFTVGLAYRSPMDHGSFFTADGLMVTGGVRIPLRRERVRAMVAEAELRQIQVDARREAFETEVRTELAEIVASLDQETRALRLYDHTLLPQAESMSESMIGAYTAGMAAFLDLLDSERMLLDLRMGREDARARYMKAVAMLDRVMGVDVIPPAP
jgi:outer membrane protein, heavy metal efflux system